MVSRLVRLLLAHRCAAVPEDVLFEALWPDRRHEQARRSLQVAVSSARAVLDIPGSGDSAIETRARTYRLRLGGGSVDAFEFEQLAGEGLRAPPGDDRRRLLDHALGAWRGEPLPEDRYEPWASPFREQLTDHYRAVLGALADEAEGAGDPMTAITHVRRLVELDVMDEGARRRLMTLQARVGRRGEALRAYLELRRALVDELGIEPAAATNDLHARILAGDPV
jgi:DNA-binding SARP family transcriptional activator